MTRSLATLCDGFLNSAERWPDHPALQLGATTLTYGELQRRALSIAATLQWVDRDAAGPARTAVLGHRDTAAFEGILGALCRGHGYVPLDPLVPVARSRAMLRRSGARSVIVEAGAVPMLDELLTESPWGLTVLAPAEPSTALDGLRARLPDHRFLGVEDLLAPDAWQPTPVEPDAEAYLLFTSGSTCLPKGVRVSHRNVTSFLDAVAARYAPGPEDRFSHTFDLTFDLSVFDLFLAWQAGACVCCPTATEKAVPARYIRSAGLTVWFSVPSTAVMMSKLRMLEPGAFGGLRHALFCGEGLPVEVARRFAAAAPGAVLENLYGPTELTVACTVHRWDPLVSPAQSELGLVPIGEPYPGMTARVVDERLREVPDGSTGELLLTGPQRTLGYLDDPELTAAAFVTLDGASELFYRTGDRVRRLPGGPLVYLGRSDHQVKLKGYRVELGEIEMVLREVSGSDVAVALGWPRSESGADGVVGFVGHGAEDPEVVRRRAAARLPSYMQPREVRVVDEWPLNANGKVDRGRLLERLIQERADEERAASEPLARAESAAERAVAS